MINNYPAYHSGADLTDGSRIVAFVGGGGPNHDLTPAKSIAHKRERRPSRYIDNKLLYLGNHFVAAMIQILAHLMKGLS
jgi:hypothetical protein